MDVAFLVFDGFELLDLAGPASVFSTANVITGQEVYVVTLAASRRGLVTSQAGVSVAARRFEDIENARFETVIVVGGLEPAIAGALRDDRLIAWLQGRAETARRTASVCTGAFLLGAAGLLAGRAATTHWAGARRFAKAFPDARLAAESIYVCDGSVWTSAGVTSGVDMALAMVGRDLGPDVKAEVARMLVVYAHRPGNQAQFSDLLRAQVRAGHLFDSTIAWIEDRLGGPIRVEDLADHAGMSLRSFFRKFSKVLGVTPAKYVELARLERARALLAAGVPVKRAASDVGFRSESAFRTAFKARYGAAPNVFRELHAPSDA